MINASFLDYRHTRLYLNAVLHYWIHHRWLPHGNEGNQPRFVQSAYSPGDFHVMESITWKSPGGYADWFHYMEIPWRVCRLIPLHGNPLEGMQIDSITWKFPGEYADWFHYMEIPWRVCRLIPLHGNSLEGMQIESITWKSPGGYADWFHYMEIPWRVCRLIPLHGNSLESMQIGQTLVGYLCYHEYRIRAVSEKWISPEYVVTYFPILIFTKIIYLICFWADFMLKLPVNSYGHVEIVS